MMKRMAIATALGFALTMGAASAQVQRGNANDQNLQQEVNKKLHEHDKTKGVNATVEDGIATLTGSVPVFEAKMDAEKRARRVDGVNGIRDQVEVAGGKSVSDQQLEEKLAEKLRYDRIGYGIMFNSLKLGVHNGVVTVAGTVRDYPDRDSALAIVENTPGVRGVVDDINVAPVSQFDDDIRIRVARAVYGDPAMTKYAMDPQAPIRIVVQNGKVDLEGVVDSQMDKQIAEMRAKSVPDVFGVTNNLIISGSNKPK